jgi:hypothetical protein
MGRPIPLFAATALRILIAWLLVMQPMIGLEAAAQAANAPLAMELCRGIVAPDDGSPAKTSDHAECCLACVPVSAPPPAGVAVRAGPAVFVSVSALPPTYIAVRRAEIGPQAARAPPR